jgi:hypothetical protein
MIRSPGTHECHLPSTYGVTFSYLTKFGLIKLDLGQIGLGGVDWTGLSQDMNKWRAVVNAVMNLQVP